MLIATLKRNGQTSLELQLPETLAEMPLHRYIDFITAARKMQETEHPISDLVRSVSAFVGVDVTELYHAELGGTGEDSLINSVSNIFGYASKLIGESSPKLYFEGETYTLNGVEYVLPYIKPMQVKGVQAFSTVSVVEAIETLEISRLLEQGRNGVKRRGLEAKIMEAAKHEASFVDDIEAAQIYDNASAELEYQTDLAYDPNGSMLYSRYLKQCAILLRQKNEHLPFDDAEREAWLAERMTAFKNIDTQTALDIDFFLSNIWETSEQGQKISGFLSRHAFALVVETLPQKPQPIPAHSINNA